MTAAMNDPRFDTWLAKMQAATQPEKNAALAIAVDMLSYPQVEALIRNGADTTQASGGIPFLSWAIHRTDDLQMAHLLLDLGCSAKGVGFDKLWAFFEEDKDSAYKLLERLVAGGMDADERMKAGIYALKHGDAGYIERRLLKPGEDIVSLLSIGQSHDAEGLLQNVAVNLDTEKNLFAAHFSGGFTAEKLADKVSGDGMTGLMLAIRAGQTPAVLDYIANTSRLGVADMLAEDRFGQSAVSLLGHRQQLAQAFAPALWAAQPEEAQKLLDAVPPRYRAQLDADRIMRDIAQNRIAGLARRKPLLPGAP